MNQRQHKIEKDHHQVVIRSPAGANPTDFTVSLTNPIRLDPHKHYQVSLHNAILTASWVTSPLGTAFTVDGVAVAIPKGHYTFTRLKDYIKSYFSIEAIPHLGKAKITVPAGSTVVLGSIAERLGFDTGVSLTAGEHISPNVVAINPVNFLSIHSNIIDVNSTRSNENVRPLLRTAVLPPCLEPYEFFDVCRGSDDYWVKLNRTEINAIDVRVADDVGRTLQVDQSIPTFWTLTIREF